MTIEEALTVFDLEKNYTEEELKKRYRELIKKNHPDYHMNADEDEIKEYNKKSQEINEAFNILKTNLKKRTNYNRTWDISKYQDDVWAEIFKQQRESHKNSQDSSNNKIYIDILNSYYTECNAPKLMEQVKNLISNYITQINNDNYNNQKVIIDFKNKLIELYQKYLSAYSQINKIPYFIIKNYIFEYDCDCAKLYSQLQSCKNKIEDDISTIIEEIKGKKHYSILEEEIKKEIETLRHELYNHELDEEDYKKILSIYSSRIKNLYNNYSRKYHRLMILFDVVLSQIDQKIATKMYQKAEIIALKEDEMQISKLYNEMLKELNYNSKSKHEIYEELRKEYLNSNPEQQELNDKLFLKATELLFSENCPTEIILTICQITFKDPKKELGKLKNINKIFNIEISEKEEVICVRKSKPSSFFKVQKIRTDNNQVSYYKVRSSGSEDIEYDEETFKKIFIPVERFLMNTTFLSYESYGGGPIIQLFYYDLETGKILGRRKNGPFRIFDESILKKMYFSQTKKLHVYLNKEYLKQELSTSFDKEYQTMSNYESKKQRK